jgi:hypothetical protein
MENEPCIEIPITLKPFQLEKVRRTSSLNTPFAQKFGSTLASSRLLKLDADGQWMLISPKVLCTKITTCHEPRKALAPEVLWHQKSAGTRSTQVPEKMLTGSVLASVKAYSYPLHAR